jgi:hypothetical protein
MIDDSDCIRDSFDLQTIPKLACLKDYLNYKEDYELWTKFSSIDDIKETLSFIQVYRDPRDDKPS